MFMVQQNRRIATDNNTNDDLNDNVVFGLIIVQTLHTDAHMKFSCSLLCLGGNLFSFHKK